MHRFAAMFALTFLLTCATARAAPISLNLESASGGFTAGSATEGWFTIDLGLIGMTSTMSSGSFLIDGLSAGSDYTVTLTLAGTSAIDTLRAEILDPIDGDDGWDVADQPAYASAGFSSSNDLDGFSFAQGMGLERGAVFAGGSATVTADEFTHRGDILWFTGLTGAEHAQITFGLRDRLGDRSFVLRLSAENGQDAAHTPEPASLLLLGTGLAGLAAARRRKQQATHN